jgi:branched-chain amino acid transport system substrate-binding protein
MNSDLTRRSLIAGLSLLPFAGQAQGLSGGTVRICQSTALSGPLGELGMAMHQGAKACFTAVNAQHGINGKTIELVSKDDGYDVQRSLANVEGFLSDRDCLALFNCMGTPMITAMLPRVLLTDMPFFAPFSGALAARPQHRSVLNIRASYPEEAEQLVQHLAIIGVKSIGIAYQNNSFGQEVLDGARQAIKQRRFSGVETVMVESDGSDAATAAAKLMQAKPDVVLIGLAGKAATEFVKAIRAQRKGLPLYGTSVMGTVGTLRALGEDAVGITVSQVVPSPQSTLLPIVQDFQQAWKALDVKQEPSHLALEGYINARVFCEVLRRAGRNPTRASLIDAAWKTENLNLGGFNINFTEPGKNASRFVELTMVGKNVRFVR